MDDLEKMNDFTLSGTSVTDPQQSWQSEEWKENDSADKQEVADSNNAVPVKKRRQKPKDCTVLICQVCGDRALGYNYDAVTCVPCKVFFKRNALKSEPPVCSFGDRCQLNKESRKCCPGCRLKKCFDVGMKKDLIMDKDQLEERRKRRAASAQEKIDISQTPQTILSDGATAPQSLPEPKHDIDAYKSTARCSAQSTSSINPGSDSEGESRVSSSGIVSKRPVEKERSGDILRPLTSELRDEMCHLQEVYMAIFASGFSEDQMKKMVERPNTNDLWSMSELLIQMTVRFVKKIPEFKCLDTSDQITLLKCIMEAVVFQSAMFFDAVNHRWMVAGKQYNERIFINTTVILKQLGETVYEEHLTFAESFKRLTKNDCAIIALLFVIMIFSPDRLHLKNMAAVKLAQDKFCHWLHMYLQSIVSIEEARKLYPELRQKLLDVRRLGEKFAEMKSTLDATSLEPLVREVFTLKI